MIVRLFINPYSDPERNKEFEFCLNKNKENEVIHEIIPIAGRPSFNQIFAKMPDDGINIIANNDIFFDESLSYIYNMQDIQCYALTRHEKVGSKIIPFWERHRNVKPDWSQDVWIFRGRPPQLPEEIYMGIPGCDNKLAYYLDFHYWLTNPCKRIRAIHVHDNEQRNYKPVDGIQKYSSPYKFIEPR